jgi:hypothetical protein
MRNRVAVVPALAGFLAVIVLSAAVQADRVLETPENWRLTDESGDFVFGDISKMVRDAEGNTYLLDTQVSQIHVVGPDGKYLRTIGRPGEGPAEFGAASGLTMLSDSVLCVSQTMPPRLVEMTTTGRALGDHFLPEDLVTAMINGCAAVEGGIVLAVAQVTYSETSLAFHTFYERIAPDGIAGPVYWEKMQKADFANITFDEKEDEPAVWAASADGWVFVSDDWDRYRIDAVSPSENEPWVLERDFDPLPRPAWQLALVKGQMEKQEMSSTTKIAETARAVSAIFPRDGGRVWVLTSRGENEPPDGCMVVFDAFDRTGDFVRRVQVRGRYVAGRDAFFMDGEHVVVVINGGPMGGAEMFAAANPAGSDAVEVRCFELAGE